MKKAAIFTVMIIMMMISACSKSSNTAVVPASPSGKNLRGDLGDVLVLSGTPSSGFVIYNNKTYSYAQNSDGAITISQPSTGNVGRMVITNLSTGIRLTRTGTSSIFQSSYYDEY